MWPIGDPVVPGARGTLGAAHPMDFVAQLDLAEVHATGLAGVDVLPPAGTLAFFHGYRKGPDEHHAGSAGAVFYFAPELALARADAPPALTPLPRVHVMFEVATEALPPVESPFYAALLGDVAAADRVAGLAACYAQEGVRDAGDRPVHRVLGYADPLQADPYVSTEGNSSVAPPSTWNTLDVLRRASRWRLLLQLDSDPERGVLYGDGGVLAFMIRDDDLAARRFERAWVELQGH